MLPASSRLKGATVRARLRPHLNASSRGISLVELLIASSILVIAVVGTAGGFNFIVSSIAKTGAANTANILVDSDIARINQMAYSYTSCVSPTGSFPDADECDAPLGTSNYYFPQSTSAAEIDKFFDACRSSDPKLHITSPFVEAVNKLSPKIGSSVTRKTAAREDGEDPFNHNIIIEYENNGSVVRVLKVAPVLSAWCG